MKWINNRFDISEDIKEFGQDFVNDAFVGSYILDSKDAYKFPHIRSSSAEYKGYYDKIPNPSLVNTDNICATMMDRYGKLKPYYPFCYAGYFFDSFIEVALFIYARDFGVKLERRPTVVNGVTLTKYLPDFKFDDRYICIRPKHLYNAKRHLHLEPDGKQGTFTGHLKVNDDIFEYYSSLGILDCIEFNDEDDFSEVIDYVNDVYGYDYIPSFYFNITNPLLNCISDFAREAYFKVNAGYVMKRRFLGFIPANLEGDKSEYLFIGPSCRGATPFDVIQEDMLRF